MNYIKKLIVKNFFSIKNQVSIDFEASKYTIENHPYRVFEEQGNFINKLRVFYGANASGKTSLLRALVYISYIASNKSDKLVRGFKNIYNAPSEQSSIEIEFHFKNINYSYRIEFSLIKDEIVGISNEVLKNISENQILINRKKNIFNTLSNEVITGILFEKVPKTKSLLVESLTRTEDYEELVEFFQNIVMLTNIRGNHSLGMHFDDIQDKIIVAEAFLEEERNKPIFKKTIDSEDKKEFKEFIFPFLQSIGLDIDNASSKIKIEKSTSESKLNFTTTHAIDTKKELDFNLESNGTKMLFKILFDIFYAYKKRAILVVDELDSILHPMIVPAINLLAIENNVQLIYTTHNTSNMKYLYSDEIQIIEKDKNHETIIKDAKNYNGYENFMKLYENNQLGGLPNISNLNFKI